MEQLFSLGCFSSQGSQSHSSWSSSGLTTKRRSLKQEKRKSVDEKGLSDSPHTTKKDNLCKSSGPAETASNAKTQSFESSQEVQFPKLQKPEVAQEAIIVKLHKHESRKGPKREAPGPEHEAPSRQKRENDSEQEERRRKRKGEVTESQVKNRLGSKHLEKTVSIRLVDIRNSDTDEYFVDEAVSRRSSVSLDATTNTKLNHVSVVSDAVAATKTNGWLRKPQANGPVSGQLRGWGKFRIPKRSEKEEKALLRPLTNTPVQQYPRTRLRTGTESDGFVSDSKPGDGDVEPCLKRCHSHQLRGDSSLSRRYGSDIIRRGVLAS